MLRKIVVLFLVLITSTIIYMKFGEKKISKNEVTVDAQTYNSNLLEKIKYVAKDDRGNEYIITAEKGEIDLATKDIIYLEGVNSFIKLEKSEEINITSDFGK